jgi:hypothetical protein
LRSVKLLNLDNMPGFLQKRRPHPSAEVLTILGQDGIGVNGRVCQFGGGFVGQIAS